MALSKNAKVAFIGTGIMGTPIAEHLISAGYDVTVYNRTPEKAQKLCLVGRSRCRECGRCCKRR